MRAGRWSALVWLGIALLTSGCDSLSNLWRAPEDRINEAFPAGEKLGDVKVNLEKLLADDADALGALQVEYLAKQKLRALTCAGAFKPSIGQSAADIKVQLNEEPSTKKCFEDFDAQQQRWLQLKRTALLLRAPPLRPIPTTLPKIITASNSIVAADFAQQAGVAVVTANRAVEVIDLNTDETLYLDTDPDGYTRRASLSPNGRVLAVASQQSGSEGVRLRDAETGEVLAELADLQSFDWLDSTTAWYTKRNTSGSFLLNVAADKDAPLKGTNSAPKKIELLPGQKEPTFVAISHGWISTFVLRYQGDEPRISLSSQQVIANTGVSPDVCATTVSGRFVVQGGSKLSVSNLLSEQTTDVSLEPYSVTSVSPLPEPDQVLISMYSYQRDWSNQKHYIFDARELTFAAVEDPRFDMPRNQTMARTVYVPSLGRVALIAGTTIKLIDKIQHGFKLTPQAWLELTREEDAKQRETKAALLAATREAMAGDRPPLGAPRAVGDIPDLAKDASIEAVGVYQSSVAPSRPGRAAGRGPVYVIVRKTSRPIVLVLSSYDPVDWKLQIDPRAQVKAVLYSGYSDSTISGAGSIRTLQMGRSYAYERGSSGFSELARDVKQWTGKDIDLFQGKYKAASFFVGGG